MVTQRRGFKMKKFTIILVLLVAVAACAPALPPSANSTDNSSSPDTAANSTVDSPDAEPDPEEPGPAPPAEPEPEPEATPKKEVIEGDLVEFPNLRAVDPDGDPIEYTFSSPLNDEGEWQTGKGDAGDYKVTITASDGVNTVSQDILIVVLPQNRPPVIELADTIEVMEGETVVIEPKVTDAEGDEVAISYTGWMKSATKATNFDDAGSYKVLVTASDGSSESSKTVVINVANKNRAPSLDVAESITVKEGETVSLSPVARDPDGDEVTVLFDEPLDQNGAWETEVGDAGEYSVKVLAKDAELSAEKTVSIVVEALNQAPTIDIAGSVAVKEGETVVLNPTVTDAEGDEFTVEYSGWMTSNTKLTGYDDQGNHKVIITAEDSNGNRRMAEIIVSVEDVNRPPTFSDDAFV